MGCLMQLTASAVAGRCFGPGAHLRARQLLEHEACTVLATDSHNLSARLPDLREGYEAAAEILGDDAAADLVEKNPLQIVQSQIARSGGLEEVVSGSAALRAVNADVTSIVVQ